MKDNERLLSLLGLCLRGRNLAVGEEAAEVAARAMDARLLLLASDAAESTLRRARHFAAEGQCVLERLPVDKAALGAAVGRGGTAIVAVTDIGLAEATAQRLAEIDEERYGETAAILSRKARRAAERRANRETAKKNAAPPEAKKTNNAESAKRRIEARHGTEKRPPRRENAKPPARRKPRADAKKNDGYARSRPVKKGKGSFRKKENG